MPKEDHTVKNRIDGVEYDLVAPDTNPSNDEIKEFVRTLFGNDPYYSFIGLTLEQIAEDGVLASTRRETRGL